MFDDDNNDQNNKMYGSYIKNGLYIYCGICNGIKTKWITKKDWNGIINVVFDGTTIVYRDSNNEEIIVYEDDEEEYYQI